MMGANTQISSTFNLSSLSVFPILEVCINLLLISQQWRETLSRECQQLCKRDAKRSLSQNEGWNDACQTKRCRVSMSISKLHLHLTFPGISFVGEFHPMLMKISSGLKSNSIWPLFYPVFLSKWQPAASKTCLHTNSHIPKMAYMTVGG